MEDTREWLEAGRRLAAETLTFRGGAKSSVRERLESLDRISGSLIEAIEGVVRNSEVGSSDPRPPASRTPALTASAGDGFESAEP